MRPHTTSAIIWRLIKFISVFIFAAVSARADWPSIRGPFSNGYISAPGDTKPIGLPLHWSETNNVKWKTEIPFVGWSTPVVMDGQIWLTTASENGHDFYAICVDANTGKIIYNEKIFHTDNPEPLGNNMNAYATPSPVIEKGRVYVHFGTYNTACIDTSNKKILWQRDDLKCRHYRGPSSSPALFENLLILTFDGIDVQYVTALDKNTGKTVWKTDRSIEWNDDSERQTAPGDHRKAHSTPIIADIGGKKELLSEAAKAAYAYDPRTGKELWRVHHMDFSVAPLPIYENGLVYLTTGLTKTELLAVKPDGEGDVTDTKIVWRLKAHVGKYASPLFVDGLIYTVADESFLSCVDAATGEVVWTERIGGRYTASPIYGDGHIYLFDRDGASKVVKPGRTYEALASNSLSDGLMACPAVDGRALILRTKTYLYRIEGESK